MSKRLQKDVDYGICCALSERLEKTTEDKALRAVLARVNKALPPGDLYMRLEECINACLTKAVDLAFPVGVQIAGVDALMVDEAENYTE